MTESDTLTIGELASRTGLSVALIRRWEDRYGYPVPLRRSGGHRRYSDDTVTVLQSVLRKRESGLRLSAALADALTAVTPYNPSLFNELRAAHPELPVHRFTMPTLLALTHAIEDECFASGDRPIVLALFQVEANFLAALARWNDIAKVSRAAYVFADFPEPAEADEVEGPVRVPLHESDHLRQEWAIVCDAVPGPEDDGPAAMPVVMAARQLPGQDEDDNPGRAFDALWSLDPAVVRSASRLLARVAVAGDAPDATELAEVLGEGPTTAMSATPAATALFARVLGYSEDDPDHH